MSEEANPSYPAEFQYDNLLDRLAGVIVREKLTDLISIGPLNCYGQQAAATAMNRLHPVFRDADSMRAELAALALQCGVALNLANPIAEVAVRHAPAGRMRIHMVLGSGVCQQPQLSVRRHPDLPVELGHLEDLGFMSAEQLDLLRLLLMQQGNFLVVGRTGSGKTTLLAAMLGSLGGRTILLEETPEIELPPPSVSLTQRHANSEGRGAIPIQRLLIESLRMRPDRVVVGEVRGTELATLLQALNNGHRGSGATLHAASVELTVQRLLLLGMLSGFAPELTSRLVAGGVDYVLQLDIQNGKRKLIDISRPILRGGALELHSLGAQATQVAA